MILLLVACAAVPFQNDPPRLDAINGVSVDMRRGEPFLPEGAEGLRVEPGSRFEIRLEVVDPDGDAVWAWWPRSPEGWVFEPESARGHWDVPEDVVVVPVELILRDDHPENPRSIGYDIPLW